MRDKKKIYIAITQTGTILSRIVKLVTRDKYNHISIALSESLCDLYSFGRINPYNPFHAGFVRESPTTGTFARFYKTDAVILEKKIDAVIYEKIKRELESMYESRAQYKYNYLGLLAGFVGRNIRTEHSFYCSQFVQYILSKHGVGLRLGESELVCPNDFLHLPESRIIYEGKLCNYQSN